MSQKRLVILGGGESGVGAAVLGKKENYDVFVSDMGAIAQEYKDVLLKESILFEENKHTNELIINANVVVKSPGIPDTAPLIVELNQKKISVISEIEFGSWFTNATIIGITGSNGKTTTASLTYHLLKAGGLNVGLGGNIGKSFAWQVAECDFDFYVLELSSFQLDGITNMKFDVSVLLNITPDHLDRYEYNFDNYIDSKFKIIKNVDENSVFIYNGDDDNIVVKQANVTFPSTSYSFKYSALSGVGAGVSDNGISVDINNPLRISVDASKLRGKHNTYNIMASVSVAKVLNIEESTIVEALGTFSSIEHRLESVLVLNGIEYINDSKATNVDSTWYALDSIADNIIWVAGGVDKGNDYSQLIPLVKSKVHGIVCLGKDNQKLLEAFGPYVKKIEEAFNAEEAVNKATAMAGEGFTVLLSPACASFDLFHNYEDRGVKFKEAIKKITSN
jgi:UDP-N-acetylmuramoylalanine--D-glutamate ligase